MFFAFAAFTAASAQNTPSIPELSPETIQAAGRGDAGALWKLGDFHRRRGGDGDAAKSLDYFRKAAEAFYEAEGASANVAIVLRDIANAAGGLGRHEEASSAASMRVDVLRALDAPAGDIAAATWDLGRTLQAAGRNEEALKVTGDAIRLYEALPGDQNRWIASLEADMGDLLQALKKPDEAIDRFRDSLETYERAGGEAEGDKAIVLGRLADAFFNQGDFATAAGYRARQVAVLKKAAAGSETHAEAVLALARDRNGERDFDAALKLIDEAQHLFDALATKPSHADVNMLMAKAYAREGQEQFEEALDLYRRSAELYAALPGQRVNEAIARRAAANTLTRLARFAEAEREIGLAIAVFAEEVPGSGYLAAAYQTQAAIFQGLSRYRDALDPLAKARAIYVGQVGDMTMATADTWLTEGISHEGLKEFETSLADYRRAKERYEAQGDIGRLPAAYAVNNMAWVYRRMDQFPKSEAMFREALPVLEKELGPADLTTTKVLINIGILCQLQGKNDEAIRWSMRALANLNRAEAATLDDQRWTYDTLSKAFKGRGDPRRAILFAKLAINAQQKIRANNKVYKAEELKEFKEEWRFLYQDLADLLIGQGRIAEAQAVLNMEKEEELIDFIQRDASADLRDSQAPLTVKEDIELADIDRILAEPIAASKAAAELLAKQEQGGLSQEEQARLDRLQASLDDAYSGFMDQVDAFLAKADAEDTSVQREVAAINLDYIADTQEELRAFDGKAGMLQVAALGEATHLFFTVPDASVHREVRIARGDLSRMVFEALDAIARRDPAVNERMHALYGVLIEPVAADMKASGIDTVMLNLQGFLRYVPFAALHDGERYLVENYALALYTPAARTRFEAGDRDPGKSAGFGVTASHPGFSPLPGVARELQAIFGEAGEPGALAGLASLDAAFTKDSFRDALKARPEIVHIASHFKLVPGRETDSFLLLGDGSPLSLSDIRKGRGFRFGGVDLLTLSACETARGGGGDGDEVESFGALAQMNGASSVMATLWPVADEATAALMRSFYRHMVEDGMSKAAALRAAQIEAIGGDAAGAGRERGAETLDDPAEAGDAGPGHPYFWSPFVLMGNWL
ncbi:MAG: CHAT domain-containing protein [Flavobacteriaceae bacterium]